MLLYKYNRTQGIEFECSLPGISLTDFRDIIRLSSAPQKRVVCLFGLCVPATSLESSLLYEIPAQLVIPNSIKHDNS